LDRDGTLNEDCGYPAEFGRIKIYPFSYRAVRKINRAGFLSVVATNQSGVGRGFFSEQALEIIHREMMKSFLAHGARLDKIYYCPHFRTSALPAYDVDCACRKPQPGLALKASAELNIDLPGSYVIGDKPDDVLFGYNIKATPVLVLTGQGQQALNRLGGSNNQPAYVAENVLRAVDWICVQEGIDASEWE
jgi:D-glycero-D-manno-heptose 1,7-bisphosphate phosphatase